MTRDAHGGSPHDWRYYDAAEVYERCLVPAIFEPWARELVAACSPRRGETVLDLACGTGTAARLLARHVGSDGRVIAVDVNAKMLAVARLLRAVPDTPIAWHQGSAVALPFRDAVFDHAVCQQGLQFFPDRLAALREIHRVLRPRGRLGLSVWTEIARSPGFAVMGDALTQHISSEAGAWLQGPFALHDADELRQLITDAGFRNVEISRTTRNTTFPSAYEFAQQYIAATPLAAFVDKAAANARRAFMDAVQTGLEGCFDGKSLTFAMEANVLTAVR